MEGGREGGREGEREGGKEGGREGERGREGGREVRGGRGKCEIGRKGISVICRRMMRVLHTISIAMRESRFLEPKSLCFDCHFSCSSCFHHTSWEGRRRGGREGGREGGEGGREGRRRGREGGKEGREGGREGGKEGREGGRENESI